MDLLIGVSLVLGVMILIHEWGHFIAARIYGVRGDVFLFGFGPRLFGWKSGNTDYRISIIPLGGYVRMAGQDPTEIDSPRRGSEELASSLPTGAPDELMSKPRWQRAVISAAGPAVNLVFPILLLTVYFVAIGIPYPVFEDKPVVVTAVPANSPAAHAGLVAGDQVIAINGEQHPDWTEAAKLITTAEPNTKVSVEIESAGQRKTLEIPVGAQKDTEQVLGFAPMKPILED